jgi:hypothetical protein
MGNEKAFPAWEGVCAGTVPAVNKRHARPEKKVLKVRIGLLLDLIVESPWETASL